MLILESQILSFVREIRGICSAFVSRGLPVFPWGTPFSYYEQYLNLSIDSVLVIGVATGMVLVMLFFSLGFSPRPVIIVGMVILVTMFQIAGTIGWLGIGLNSLPVEIALLGVSLITFASIQYIVVRELKNPYKRLNHFSFNLIYRHFAASLGKWR